MGGSRSRRTGRSNGHILNAASTFGIQSLGTKISGRTSVHSGNSDVVHLLSRRNDRRSRGTSNASLKRYGKSKTQVHEGKERRANLATTLVQSRLRHSDILVYSGTTGPFGRRRNTRGCVRSVNNLGGWNIKGFANQDKGERVEKMKTHPQELEHRS